MSLKKDTILQFIKFGLVGCSNTVLSYACFYACISFGWHYLIANSIGFVVGVLNAYYWSNKYVFNKHEDGKRNHFVTLLKTFAAYSITGVFLQSLLLFLFVDRLEFDSRIAQLICLSITVPLNFLLNKFWSFK